MTLTIPDIPPDGDTLTAALAYAAAGWYVIPIKRGTKHPGSILGRSWQRQSTRDTDQIVAWWAGTDNGIALHCGRSGAVVLDIDNPDKIPDVIRQHGGQPPAQLTRPDTPDRKHLVYQVPAGRQLGNGNGQLGGAWGEVRGQNGVIVVAPSYHPEGGEYRWLTTGPVPVLPEPIAAMLPDADMVDADAATDEQVAAFLDSHTAGSNPGLIGALVNRFRQRIEAGESRHQTGASMLSWAMDEAVAGIYSAREADSALRKLFIASKTEVAEAGGRPVLSQRAAAREWDGIRAWAVGRALAKTTDRRAERAERAATVPRDDAAAFNMLAGVGRQPGVQPPSAAQPDVAQAASPSMSAQAAFLTGGAPALPPPPVVDDEQAVKPLRLVKASSIRSTMPTWAWEYAGAGRILKGGLTLFAGRPAAGKSTTARWFAASWTNGTVPGCWEGKPVNVAYIATEEAWNHTVVPSLKAAGADMDRVFFIQRGDNPARVKAKADEVELTEMFLDADVRAVFLDPLMSTIGGSDDTYRSNEVREALDPWVRISEAIDGVALGITHLTKNAKNVTAGINGSSAFGEVARCVFGFAVDKEADDGTRVMTQDKNSSGIGGLNLAYRIGQQMVTFDDGGTGPMARFELIGTTDRTVSDLLSEEQASGNGGRSAKNECMQWLKGYLTTKGPTPSLEVRAAGADLGFSESAIKRAAQKLDIQQERTREVPSKTLWRLPSDTESDDE
ncbi:DNA primase/polymerase [Mycobacterium phage Omnicron]|uniref:DNA primase/polymerase n=1 Tax=Mycobacterium phage Omnicron TaxID=1541819 RepID=A0A088FQ90_9CAUD|nr:DNA polymerase/primase [Mycobacterium phage Omnicron]AIM50400.1 DNA primase/polymerase [Mycobacterium phage Omnicron]